MCERECERVCESECVCVYEGVFTFVSVCQRLIQTKKKRKKRVRKKNKIAKSKRAKEQKKGREMKKSVHYFLLRIHSGPGTLWHPLRLQTSKSVLSLLRGNTILHLHLNE